MITPIFILSILFIGIAFIVNENNAKYLLSGYNMMSEEERQKFDIKCYIPFFRNFHLFLGISLFVIALLLFYFVDADWSGIFMGTYPILAYVYFIWKGKNYSTEKTTKQKAITYITVFAFLFLFVFIAFEFKQTLNDNKITLNNNQIEIDGEYGTEIKLTDLKSIQLVNKLPEIHSKIKGFALETIKKGDFTIVNDKEVKLLINSDKTPLLLITTKDNQKIYYSSKDESNTEIYNDISTKINVKNFSDPEK
ncbi:DUF3784 domain-containing protein [Flavobacterium ajazii]|uniref:DUF3784 domain-containing protein n=1 Tax=Flavobacterium ajazii TaxID=2692318 RepID=UPI0013D0F8AF|nr:DUF3784 domain-containing protein [Flavobacterium ajazii]